MSGRIGANWIISISKDKKFMKISLILERRAIHTANTAYTLQQPFSISLSFSPSMNDICVSMTRVRFLPQPSSNVAAQIIIVVISHCFGCTSVVHRQQMTKQFHSYSFSWIMSMQRFQLVVVRECLKMIWRVSFQAVWYASHPIECT